MQTLKGLRAGPPFKSKVEHRDRSGGKSFGYPKTMPELRQRILWDQRRVTKDVTNRQNYRKAGCGSEKTLKLPGGASRYRAEVREPPPQAQTTNLRVTGRDPPEKGGISLKTNKSSTIRCSSEGKERVGKRARSVGINGGAVQGAILEEQKKRRVHQAKFSSTDQSSDRRCS